MIVSSSEGLNAGYVRLFTNAYVCDSQEVLITEINVTIIDEYTGNILGEMTTRQFTQSYGANVRDNIIGLQFTFGNAPYRVTRQSTEISAYPAYEVYVQSV